MITRRIKVIGAISGVSVLAGIWIGGQTINFSPASATSDTTTTSSVLPGQTGYGSPTTTDSVPLETTTSVTVAATSAPKVQASGTDAQRIAQLEQQVNDLQNTSAKKGTNIVPPTTRGPVTTVPRAVTTLPPTTIPVPTTDTRPPLPCLTAENPAQRC